MVSESICANGSSYYTHFKSRKSKNVLFYPALKTSTLIMLYNLTFLNQRTAFWSHFIPSVYQSIMFINDSDDLREAVLKSLKTYGIKPRLKREPQNRRRQPDVSVLMTVNLIDITFSWCHCSKVHFASLFSKFQVVLVCRLFQVIEKY